MSRRRLWWAAVVLAPVLVLTGAASSLLLWRLTDAVRGGTSTASGAVAPAVRRAVHAPPAAAGQLPPLDGGTAVDAPPADPAFARASTTVSVQDVHAALGRRTAALRAHNEKAFLATFDAGRPALVTTERILFRNLVKLPLVSPSYLESQVTGSSTSRRAYVSLAHQIRGVDAEAAELTKVETFVRRKGAVVTTAVAAVRGQPSTRYAPLDQVPLTVTNGRLVTVVSTRDVGDATGVSATAERAAAAVLAVWGSRPGPSRFVVFATRDQKAVGTWFGAGSAPFQAAGATMLQVALRHPTRYTGSRVIVDLSQSSGEALYRVLRHEFTHAVDVRAQTVPRGNAVQNYPTWVEEGMAAWVEELDVPVAGTSAVQSLRVLRQYWNHQLPPDSRDAFYVNSDRGAYNYALAATVYRYVDTRWGTSRAIGFYAAFAAGTPSAAFSSLGTDRAGFVSGWGAWVDAQLA